MQVLEPWMAVPVAQRAALERQLAAEISAKDELWGHRATAIARRQDNDDVLYEIDGIGFVVVHLTWTKSAFHPRRTIYTSLRAFEPVMQQDHRDFTDTFEW